MAAEADNDLEFVPILQMEEEASAMLAYANSAQARAHIQRARQEILDGKGFELTGGYFGDLKHRVSKRIAQRRSIEA